LASLLVQEGVVSAKKMAEAFQRQVIYGGTLDTILLEMDILDEATLTEALGRASHLVTAGDLPSPEALQAANASRWFPHSVSERYRAVPISLEGNVLRVLVTDPPDRKQLDELGYMLSLSVDPIIVPELRFVQAVELVYHVPLPARFQSLAGKLRLRAPKPAPKPEADADLAKVAKLAETMKTAANVVVQPKIETYENALPTISMPTISPDVLKAAVEAERRAAEPPQTEPPIEVARAVVSDVPMPAKEAVPDKEMDEQPTPRITMRQVSSPVAQIAPEMPLRVREELEPSAVALWEASALIDKAADRDGIFESLCRGARSLVEFAALFTVQGEQALGKLALSDSWASRDIMARIAAPLDRPSALQAVSRTHAPFLGRLGDEPVSEAVLQALGRNTPLPGVIVPIVLRERTVALVYGDAAGRPVDASIVAGLSSLAAAAARAFQRLILKQKGGEYSRAPAKEAAAGKLAAAPQETAKGGSWGAVTPDQKEAKPAAKVRTTHGLAAAMGVKETAAPRSSIHEMPTQQIRQLDSEILDMDAMISSVLMNDDRAHDAAASLLALQERGALAVVARMPGPLKLARHTLRGAAPPLAEHGPLLQLIARFGKHALGPLLARLSDSSIDVRYYATLAVGELQLHESIVPLGARLFDPDAGVRAVATQGLLRHGDVSEMRLLRETLRGELTGPDPLRQQCAAEALGTLRDAESVPRLVDLVKNEEAAVVLAARHALLEITKQDFGNSRWRWRSWWERHRGEPRVEWMLEGLGHAEAEVRESASEELRRLSPDSFGYHFDLPKREREEARKRWVDWWRAQKKN
jgi:HEAT repeat protein